MSPSSRKTVLIIGCDTRGAEQFFTNDLAFEGWCKKELDASLLANVISSLVQKGERELSVVSGVVRKIKQQWKQVDGIVCILPPAQFLLTATQLAFEVGPIGKPIVCTTVVDYKSVSGHSFYTHHVLPLHMMNAVQVATVDVSGVLVVGGSEVFPVTHAAMGGHDKRLVSVDRLVYAHVDFGVRKTAAATPLSSVGVIPKVVSSGGVALVDGSVSDSAFVIALKDVDYKQNGIAVINGHSALQRVVDAECAKHLPILLCEGSRVHLREKGQWHAIERLTVSSAVAKYVWILTHRKSHAALKSLSLLEAMQTNMIGETLL